MAEALRRLDGFDRAACRRRAQLRFSASRMVEGYERVYARAVAQQAAVGAGAAEAPIAG